MRKCKGIGVTGGTGSGKSTIARAVIDTLLFLLVYSGREDIACVMLDWFYRCRGHLETMEEREVDSFDVPKALDHEMLSKVLHILLNLGQNVRAPGYDFATKTRQHACHPLSASSKLVVFDGIFLLVWEEVTRHLDVVIAVRASEQVRLERRIARDIIHRGTSEERTREMWPDVQAGYLKYIEPYFDKADIIVDNDNGQLFDAVKQVMLFLLEKFNITNISDAELDRAIRASLPQQDTLLFRVAS